MSAFTKAAVALLGSVLGATACNAKANPAVAIPAPVVDAPRASIAAKQTAGQMREQKVEDSLNVFVMRCGLTSLDDAASHQQAQQRNAADRDEFMKQASTRKLKVIPSSTNFVMFNANRPVRTVIDHFKKNNVSIGRPFPPLDTYTRISLGTPEQMKEFWRVWDALS